MKVSVVIPVYNAENTLVRCVDSIIYGEYKDVEVLLFEDYSSDNSWSICQQLSEQYENVFCYRNDCNRGVSYTRNRGITEAHGDFILFVDSDDWVSGKYVATLVKEAKISPDSLIICGCHFHEEVVGYKRDYIWEIDGKEKYTINKANYFELPKRFHLQQLWNKIFRADYIRKYNIRFDESQSMGEDYQFVLDYLESANIQQSVVINKPLYFYIRANRNSLMSKFGLIETDNEYKRLKQLLRICGKEKKEIQNEYNAAVHAANYNFVYQIIHAKSVSAKEKKALIASIMQDGKESKYYFEQSCIKLKEELSVLYKNSLDVFQRVGARLQRHNNKIIINRARNNLIVNEFTVISQNCIGGVFYHDLKKQFLTPTINLFFSCSDFVKFVQNLEYYMNLELEIVWGEEYPIGYLDDIEIHFMHYQSCKEAKKKWNDRKSRIRWDQIIVLCTDMEGFDNNVYEEWKKITYPKLLFSATNWNDKSIVYFPQYSHDRKVHDLILKREFYKDDRLITLLNNCSTT